MTTTPINQQEHKTILGELARFTGTTQYSFLYIRDHTGKCITVRRGDMLESVRKKIMWKAGFFSLEVRGNELYYRKYVECERSMFKLLKDQHRERLASKSRERAA